MPFHISPFILGKKKQKKPSQSAATFKGIRSPYSYANKKKYEQTENL